MVALEVVSVNGSILRIPYVVSTSRMGGTILVLRFVRACPPGGNRRTRWAKLVLRLTNPEGRICPGGGGGKQNKNKNSRNTEETDKAYAKAFRDTMSGGENPTEW